MAAAATARGEVVALVDTHDRFDPGSAQAAGVDLARLLWIRESRQRRSRAEGDEPGTAGRRLRRGGVRSRRTCSAPALRQFPHTTWMRIARVIEGQRHRGGAARRRACRAKSRAASPSRSIGRHALSPMDGPARNRGADRRRGDRGLPWSGRGLSQRRTSVRCVVRIPSYDDQTPGEFRFKPARHVRAPAQASAVCGRRSDIADDESTSPTLIRRAARATVRHPSA